MPDRPPGIVAYFASIETKYGKPIDAWFAVLEPHRDLGHMEMVRLLKNDYGMGHGHANAIVGNVPRRAGDTLTSRNGFAVALAGFHRHRPIPSRRR